MLESYVVARDRFLKPDGLMMPSTGSIVLAPYSDDSLYKEQLTKIAFWENNDFYGVDLSSVLTKVHSSTIKTFQFHSNIFLQARSEYFSQAVVGSFPMKWH